MQDTSAKKPGIKTSEFWITILGTIIIAGAEEVGLDIKPACAIGIAVMIIAYITGRVINKNMQGKVAKK